MNPCDWWGVSSVCDAVGDAASGIAEDASVSVLRTVARAVTGFAGQVLESLWDLIQTVTTPQTDAEFLYRWAGLLFGISLPLTVAFMCFQVIGSVLRARGVSAAGIGQAVLGAAAAIFGTAMSLPVVHYLTGMVDGAADAMTAVTLGDVDQLGESFSAAVGGDGVLVSELFTPLGRREVVGEALAGVLGGLVGMIVLGFLMAMGAIAVFAALLIRTLLLYVVIVTGPIAFLGLVWSPTRVWFRRWATAVVALIFTKLGVVVVFGLGISAMNTLDMDGGLLEVLGRLLTGTVLVLIASLVPIVAFKFFGFLGEQTVEVLHSGAQSGVERGREVAGRMNPQQILDRIRTTPADGGAAPALSPDRLAGAPPRQHHGLGGSASDGRPGPGAPNPSEMSTPAGVGSGRSAAGASAGGAAAAVVGGGAAIAGRAASAGTRAADHASEHDPGVGPAAPAPSADPGRV
jgi:TrbL/VirB6 plasmid conjugal transfer protein